MRLLVVLALFLVALTPASAASPAKLVLGTGALAPLTTADGEPGFLDLVVGEAFRRAGREAELVVLPVERALANANAGIEDGDAFRAPGFEKAYPNLRQVPESIFVFEFMGWSGRPDIRVQSWADLKPYVAGYAIGWKLYERMVKDSREVTQVRSIDQLFLLLADGRLDVALADRWQAARIVRRANNPARPLEPPLAKVDMYIYLHRRHERLLPEVARGIAAMKVDGTYQRIVDRVLTPLLRR